MHMDPIWLLPPVGLGVGLVAGVALHKVLTDRRIGTAEVRARRVVEDAQREADTRRKTAELEAREIALKTRAELDEETRRRQREIQQVEQRIVQKDEQLTRKLDQIERRIADYELKEHSLLGRERAIVEKETRLSSALDEHRRKLEAIAGLTAEEAKRQLLVGMEEGERACFEVGVQGLHPELVKLVGRMKFRTSYGQNCLQHSKEVAWLGGMMAAEIGADVKLAKRMGLLHDIGKALTHEQDGSHPELSLQVLTKYSESPQVINAALCGHEDVKAETVEAVLTEAAAGISAARPGARRDVLESYIKRLAQLEEIALSYKGVDMCYAIQAGRELRVMTRADVVSDLDAHQLAKDISKRIEAEMQYPGHIKVVVIRETRAVEVAR